MQSVQIRASVIEEPVLVNVLMDMRAPRVRELPVLLESDVNALVMDFV